MKLDPCPNPDELRSFVRCTVSEQRAELISEHLERCRTCEEMVVELERDGDTLADWIKAPAARPQFANESECQRLMQSLLGKTNLSLPDASSGDVSFAMFQSLRDYQIVAKLGEGGMGAVFKAVHQRLKKTVALKVLPTSRIGDVAAVSRFEREMEVLGRLNHPNIVQALDAGEHDGQHYLVMEFVEGSDLSEVVRSCSPLSVADACELIAQAATGLQYAHEHGFVHRDIKPSNLMLSRESRISSREGSQLPGTQLSPLASHPCVKILDMGLARMLEHSPHSSEAGASSEITTTGQIMGTLDYMAPEQGGDSHQVDIRADIYSLGATLYKLLTGQAPYAEHAQKSPMQRLMAIAQHDPPSIATKRADIPPKLAAVVHKMLAKNPDDRFATPSELVQALSPFCTGADLAALLVPSGATPVLAHPSSATAPTFFLISPQKANGPPSRPHSRKLFASLAAFVMLAAIVVITTRHGTVEVTSSDGQLPADVKVVVSRGGDEVELLQADNPRSHGGTSRR